MTGVVKTDYSPKKGKENKNISNHIPVPTTVRKYVKNEAQSQLSPKKEVKKADPVCNPTDKSSNDSKSDKEDLHRDVVEDSDNSTSNRPVRPQTKILRRPTPNLKHPVIQVDSDESGGDSSGSDKSKEEDNPKRLKMGSENNSSDSSAHKTKNFIMYNKYNVEKNIKNGQQKERTSATLPTSIPNPCTSCNRSTAPERLHSHAQKDARGLMHSRKSPTMEVKTNMPASEARTTSVPPIVDVKMSIEVKAIMPVATVNIKTNSQTSDSKIPFSGNKIPSPIMNAKVVKHIPNANKVSSLANDSKQASPKTNNKVIDVKMLSSESKMASLATNKVNDVKMLSCENKMVSSVTNNKVIDVKMLSVESKIVPPSTNNKVIDVKTLSADKKMVLITTNNKVTEVKMLSGDTKITSPTTNNKDIDVKMLSPQKKVQNNSSSIRPKLKRRDNKRSSSLERTKSDPLNTISSDITQGVNIEKLDLDNGAISINSEQNDHLGNFVEPIKMCYICQKEFKVSLLQLHESKCLEEWKKTNNSLPPNQRQLPPRRPPDHDLAPSIPFPELEDADDPIWSAVQSQLVPCPLCFRTFFPERMPVHRRVCKGRQSPRPLKRASSLREQSASSTEGEEAKDTPMYLPCFVCSRSYGSWVLPMHEQQCLKKYRKENENLPDEDRQDETQRSTDLNTDDDVASLIELGDTAWESHLQQLVPCPRCSRTFFPDRLQIHERSCKGMGNNRRPHSNKGN